MAESNGATDPVVDPLGTLRRWQRAGGSWQILAHTASRATIALCRCDGGEELERFASTDPDLLAYLADHPDGEG